MHRGRHKWKTGLPDHGGPVNPPSHMQRYLSELAYPTRTAYLVEQARQASAPPDVVQTLRHLDDHNFLSADEVMAAVQKLTQPKD